MGATREEPTRIGVYGGTFDPVHLGHLILASELRHALALDRVLFVPAGRPPHKTGQAIGDETHRLTMLRLALADNPAFALSTVDLDRAGTSYTADLLHVLSGTLAPAKLFFLMGEDSLRDLPTWHQPTHIAALAELGVARRPGVDVDLEAVLREVPSARGRVHLVPMPPIGIASHDLRRRVRAGEPIRYLVPEEVEAYIAEHGLYRR